MLHIYYGKGKGKTSSALGLIIRACGYKKRVVLFRFLKPKSLFTGEDTTLNKLPNVKEIRFNYPHPMFLKKLGRKDMKSLRNQVRHTLIKLKETVKRGKFDILVLDEILNLMDLGLVNDDELIKLIKQIEDKKEVILTGRKAPKKLKEIANYITEFKLIKHPFQKGIFARKGIEY